MRSDGLLLLVGLTAGRCCIHSRVAICTDMMPNRSVSERLTSPHSRHVTWLRRMPPNCCAMMSSRRRWEVVTDVEVDLERLLMEAAYACVHAT